MGTEVKIICSANITTRPQVAQVVQDLWNTVGFKVTVEPLDTVPFLNARKQGEFGRSPPRVRAEDEWRTERSFQAGTRIRSGWGVHGKT